MICFYIGSAVNLAFFAVVLYAVARVKRQTKKLTVAINDSRSDAERFEVFEKELRDLEKNASAKATLDVALEERVDGIGSKVNALCAAIDAVQSEAEARVAKLRKDCESTAKRALDCKNEVDARLDALDQGAMNKAGKIDALKTGFRTLRESLDDLAARFDKIEKEHVQYAKARNFAVDAFYKSNRAVRECLKQYEEETNENATI